MKKLLLAAIAVGLFAALLLFRSPAPLERAPGAPPAALAPAEIPAKLPELMNPKADHPEDSALSAASPPAAENAPLSASARAAVKECWGKELSDWKQLSAGFQALGAKGHRELQWRVLRTEGEGRETRVRLSREPRENGEAGLGVKVYSVDEEGLPDALPPAPGQRENPAGWLSNFLRGKTIVADTRLEEITLPDGHILSLETEGGTVVEAQVQGRGKGLACSRKENDPRCRCL